MEDRQKLDPNTEFDLQNWGLQHMAYLRQTHVDGHRGYGIYSATGEMIGFATNRGQALGAIIQNDLEPVALH